MLFAVFNCLWDHTPLYSIIHSLLETVGPSSGERLTLMRISKDFTLMREFIACGRHTRELYHTLSGLNVSNNAKNLIISTTFSCKGYHYEMKKKKMMNAGRMLVPKGMWEAAHLLQKDASFFLIHPEHKDKLESKPIPRLQEGLRWGYSLKSRFEYFVKIKIHKFFIYYCENTFQLINIAHLSTMTR